MSEQNRPLQLQVTDPKADPNTDPIADPALRRQLEQLFGESLFGPWPELGQGPQKTRRRRSLAWLWKLGVVGVVALLFWGGRALFQPGLERQVRDDRANYAAELQAFLNDGNLSRAAQFVTLVQVESPQVESGAIDPKDPYCDLIVSTEAALYRYYDAKPERLNRIRPLIEQSEHASLRQLVAGFTVASREERAGRLSELERLHNELPNDNEVEYLLATALEQKGASDAAREAWERSAKLGPAWLGHRFEHAWFEWHRDRKPSAEKIARQMLRVDPDSTWAKLAAETFELPNDIEVESVRGDAAAPPPTTPVQIHFRKLQESVTAARQNSTSQAKARLVEAMSAIQHQQAFLLDAFDWLLEAGRTELARELTLLSEWPKESSIAQAKQERLAALGDKGEKVQRQEASASAPAAAGDPHSNQEATPPSSRRRSRRK